MHVEDDQQSFFFQQQQDQFFPQPLPHPELQSPSSIQPFNYIEHYKNMNEKLEESQIFEDWGFITEQQKRNFEKFTEHNKYMTGLQGMITLSSKEKHTSMLMNEEFELGTFFNDEPISTKEIYEREVAELTKIVGVVDNNLVENFENFAYIEKTKEESFLEKWVGEYQEQLVLFREKKDKVELFGDIFRWWLEGFRNMVLEIEKCSPIYTLNIFKKEKEREKERQDSASMLVEMSAKESEQEDIKQRKLWSRHELERLNRLMDLSHSVSASQVKEVASQLGRSVVAVQSKIQKLYKEKRDRPLNDLSLEKKMLIVLASFPFGLSKEELLAKMQAQFEMGDEDTWKKSVSQLLSVSKKVGKSKGIFSFISTPVLQPPTNFKNKVIACLYELPNQRGNLKFITKKYVEKFSSLDGINPEDPQRIKLIEASIYKTIFKYDIFDKSNSKIVYKFVDNDARDSQSDRSESGSKDYGM